MHRKDFIVLILGYLFCFFFVSRWFLGNNILAAAEEGIPFFQPDRSLHLYNSLWTPSTFGVPIVFYLPRVPLYLILSLLFKLGLTSQVLQIHIYSILIFTALWFVYKLIELLSYGKISWEYKVLSSLFYLFNFYTISQVWYRFLGPHMFLWAYLPLFLFVWINWIRHGKLKYLFALLLSSIVYCYAFSFPSSVMVVWSVAFLFSFIEMISTKSYMTIIKRSFFGLIIWFLINLWWIYPFWSLRNATYSEMLADNRSMVSLEGVSKFYPNKELLTLQQKYLFREEGHLYKLYTSDKREKVAVMLLGVSVLGLLTSRKMKSWIFISSVAAISWFVCKGSNPPFGKEFYSLIFSQISFTQVLRNPYEKYGVVFVLAYSVFFGLGVNFLARLVPKLKYFIILFFIFILVGYVGRPLRNGNLFLEHQVTIPSYYSEVNEYMGDQGGRVLVMPFLRGSNIAFKWGYRGDEPSDYLWDKDSISKIVSIDSVDKFYMLLSHGINNKNFGNFLALTNTSHVMLNKDVELSTFHQENIPGSEAYIKLWDTTDSIKEIGNIKIFTVKKDLPVGDIYAVSSISPVESLDGLSAIVLSDKFNPRKEAIIVREQNNGDFMPGTMAAPSNISFEKLSSRKYTVSVKNAQKPFVLILTQNYNSQWLATSEDKTFTDHIKINGYANGWLIDKQGDFNIDIIFSVWPWEK